MLKLRIGQKHVIICMLIFHTILAAATIFINNWLLSFGFIFFTASYAALMFITIFLKTPFVVKFFNIFIYLGFYLKVCLHSVFIYSFSEPIGDFRGSEIELNDFFEVSSLAAVAICFATILISNFSKNYRNKISVNNLFLPRFAKYYKLIFGLLLISCIAVSVINIKMGINISGLAAVTILPWPLNSFIGFLLYVGFSILIAIYGYMEFKVANKLNYTTLLILMEGAFSSVSILSRGLFLFHFLPYLLCLLIYRSTFKYNLKKIFYVSCWGFAFFIISGFLVTNARSALYDNYDLNKTDYRNKNIFNIDIHSNITKDELGNGADSISNDELDTLNKEKLETRLAYIDNQILYTNSLEDFAGKAALLENLDQIKRHILDKILQFTFNEIILNMHNLSARLKVLDGGIEHAKELIRKGEHQEKALVEMSLERDKINQELNQLKLLRNKSVLFGKNYLSRTNADIECSSEFCRKILMFSTQIARLVVDRWIGAEGLMAVVSYPEKNLNLIYSTLLRVPKVGEKDIFEKMNKSFYPISTKYVFTSLPGPVAFFYYSGSKTVVFIGIFSFVFFMFGVQYFIDLIIKNIFVHFLTSFSLAVNFMQFGISPRPLLIAYVMLFAFLIFIRICSFIFDHQIKSEELNA